VQNDQVYEIEESILVRPGPRVVDALEALAKLLHPELFG
jgi:iron complex transport system substrate-binding protein